MHAKIPTSVAVGVALLIGACRTQDSTTPTDTSPASDAGPEDSADSAGPRDSTAPLPDSPRAEDGGETGAWTAVPGGEACSLTVADVSTTVFPKRTWTACGKGCRVSDAMLGGFVGAYSSSASASFTGGDVILHVAMTDAKQTLVHVSRLSDDATLAAARIPATGGCRAIGLTSGSPLSLPFLSTDGGDQVLLGRAEIKPAPLHWGASWIALPALMSSTFLFDEGFGATLRDGTVRLVSPAEGSAFTTIDTLAGPAYTSTTSGKLALWPFWGVPTSVIKGYSKLGGARTFVTQASVIHSVALSADKLVWIGTHGPQAPDGIYASAELYSSPAPAAPADVIVTTGPTLPALNGLNELQTAGDYAAFLGFDTSGSRTTLIVVRLSTKAVWQLPSRPASTFTRVLAVTPDEILLGENAYPVPAGGYALLNRLVRLETTAIPGIASGGW